MALPLELLQTPNTTRAAMATYCQNRWCSISRRNNSDSTSLFVNHTRRLSLRYLSGDPSSAPLMGTVKVQTSSCVPTVPKSFVNRSARNFGTTYGDINMLQQPQRYADWIQWSARNRRRLDVAALSPNFRIVPEKWSSLTAAADARNDGLVVVVDIVGDNRTAVVSVDSRGDGSELFFVANGVAVISVDSRPRDNTWRFQHRSTSWYTRGTANAWTFFNDHVFPVSWKEW